MRTWKWLVLAALMMSSSDAASEISRLKPEIASHSKVVTPIPPRMGVVNMTNLIGDESEPENPVARQDIFNTSDNRRALEVYYNWRITFLAKTTRLFKTIHEFIDRQFGGDIKTIILAWKQRASVSYDKIHPASAFFALGSRFNGLCCVDKVGVQMEEWSDVSSWGLANIGYLEVRTNANLAFFEDKRLSNFSFDRQPSPIGSDQRLSGRVGSLLSELRRLPRLLNGSLSGFRAAHSSLRRVAGFTKGESHKHNTGAGYTYARNRYNDHPERPTFHAALGIKIVLITFVFAGGAYYLFYALSNSSRRLSIETVVLYALLGTAGIVISMAFAALIVTSGI